MTSPERKPTVVRLDPDLREWLDTYAEQTKRSLNGAVNFLLEKARNEIERAEQVQE